MAKMAILAKIARGMAIMAINAPAPWRPAILAKMTIVAKLAIFAKITRGLAISRMWDYIQIGCQKWPLQVDNERGLYTVIFRELL